MDLIGFELTLETLARLDSFSASRINRKGNTCMSKSIRQVQTKTYQCRLRKVLHHIRKSNVSDGRQIIKVEPDFVKSPLSLHKLRKLAHLGTNPHIIHTGWSIRALVIIWNSHIILSWQVANNKRFNPSRSLSNVFPEGRRNIRRKGQVNFVVGLWDNWNWRNGCRHRRRKRCWSCCWW